MPIFFILLLMLAAQPVFPGDRGEASAQSTSLDEGSFTLTRQGAPAGSETFSIRQSGTGDDARVIAQAQIRISTPEGTLEMAPALQASGADRAISAYQIKVSGDMVEEVYVTLGERRFLTKVVSEEGERQREYRANPGTLLLDAGVAHQFYFLGTRIEGGVSTLPVIIPREGRQIEMQVTEIGNVNVRISDQDIAARHIRLEGGGEVREVWIDSAHRVLRVSNPGTGYLAVRESPPA